MNRANPSRLSFLSFLFPFFPTMKPTHLDFIHNVELSQSEVAAILYYLESYFCGSDENPEDDQDIMSIFAKLENLSSF
jgi:hypothetical protein